MARAKTKAKKDKSSYFVEIFNMTHSGKQVIVFSGNEWKHLWISGKSSKSVQKPYTASSSMLEMIRRRQLEVKE